MKNLELIGIGDNVCAGMAPKKAKKRAAKKRGTWTIDPPSDLREQAAMAIKATGKDRTKLVIECVREALPRVVAKILEERKKAAEAFHSAHGEGNRKTGTDTANQ